MTKLQNSRLGKKKRSKKWEGLGFLWLFKFYVWMQLSGMGISITKAQIWQAGKLGKSII